MSSTTSRDSHHSVNLASSYSAIASASTVDAVREFRVYSVITDRSLMLNNVMLAMSLALGSMFLGTERSNKNNGSSFRLILTVTRIDLYNTYSGASVATMPISTLVKGSATFSQATVLPPSCRRSSSARSEVRLDTVRSVIPLYEEP